MATTIAQTMRSGSRALVLIGMMIAPLIAVGSVRAGDQSVIEGTYKKSSGAGLVLVVSLQRAQ